MRISREFTIQLPDGPGDLGAVVEPMAQAAINIDAMSLVDSPPHMILRLITSRPDEAVMIFERLGRHVTSADVLAVDLSNEPGALAEILRRLDEANIAVNYAYISTSTEGACATGIISVDDPHAALDTLNPA
ncbi:hypothetical protein HED60_14845 [Planctomycetales bacterium ZRK34]|nr:hypothetical protein HED60_14845 [Planctomycetales bacterium ZRK34]